MIYTVGVNSLFPMYESKTIQDVIDYCSSKKKIGVDIETTRKYAKNKYREDVYKPGLDPYVTRIIMLQIGDEEVQFIIDARKIDLTPLKEILESDKILKVGHNLKFESKFLFLHYGIYLKNIHDTMITEKVLYNGLDIGFSLESLMKRYLGYKSADSIDLFNVVPERSSYNEDSVEWLDFKETVFVDKSIRLQFIEWGDKEFTDSQIQYGAEDIISPLKIMELQKQNEFYPKIGIELENRFVPFLAKVELRGIKVDIEAWKSLYEENKKTYIKRRESLDKWVCDNVPQFTDSNTFFGDKICKIDWQSSKSVISLARHLGFCPKEKSKATKKMEWTVGAKAMFKLLPNNYKESFFKGSDMEMGGVEDISGFIYNYLLFKKAQQLTTTFGLDWLKFVHPITGRVHTNFIQLMSTGRLSSTSPNLNGVLK
jgi:DNA polymerase I-like protein with 3'-5' exonuclease and polymerase domains